MKKLFFVLLFLVLAIFFWGAIGVEQANGDPGKRSPAALAAPECYISDVGGLGVPITSMSPSSVSGEYMFWMALETNGPAVQTVKFVVKLPRTCPNAKQVYKFSSSPGWTAYLAPFGVVDWSGGVCNGDALLKVKTEYFTCTYPFTIH